jgi:hypothetical protein
LLGRSREVSAVRVDKPEMSLTSFPASLAESSL